MESTSSTQPSLMKTDDVGHQVYVISPNQLSQLGFSAQIHSISATHVQPEQTLKLESDNSEEQALSTTSSNSEEDENNTWIAERNYSKTSNLTRKPINVEIVQTEHPSRLQNEMKSKLHHLLNTNANNNESSTPSPSAGHNVNTSIIKDSPKMHILNYETSPLSINCPQFNTTHSMMTDRKSACVTNAKIMSAHADVTAARQNVSGIADNIERMSVKHLSHDFVKLQQTVPRIINSQLLTEATKCPPLKLEIVSNEIVNFSPMEIQNILKHNTSQSKVTESVPQSMSNTIINKSAYLQNSPCTEDNAASKVEKHFKKKLYETFHVADNTSVEKGSNDTYENTVNLDCTLEEFSDRGQNITENSEAVSQSKQQSFKVYDNTKDKNSFLPPRGTFFLRQAEVQILNNSFESKAPCKEVEFEPTNKTEKSPNKNNNDTELKVAETNCVQQEVTPPILLNTLLQRKSCIDVGFHENISDQTPKLLNRLGASNSEVKKIQHKTDLEILSNSTFKGEQIKEINEFSEKNKLTDEIFVNKQEIETTSLNKDSRTEQEKEVEKLPMPRVLNLELQEKKDVITNQSYLDSNAIYLDNQKKKNLQNPEIKSDTCPEEKQTVPIAQSSKLHDEILKKVNIFPAHSQSTKPSCVIKKKRYELFHEKYRSTKTRYQIFRAYKNVNVKKSKFRYYGKIKKVNTITSDSSLQHNKNTSDVGATTVKVKYFKLVKKENVSAVGENSTNSIAENSTNSNLQKSSEFDVTTSDTEEIISKQNSIAENSTNSNLQKSSEFDVTTSDTDEIISKQNLLNTNRKQENMSSTDINVYVQSKISGRKRKYVDYKVLSGISRHCNSSDSESINEDTPVKKCATDKPTDATCNDKSIVEIKLPKKQGRGRPRRSEVRSSECDVQVKLDTSESEILNLEVKEQCDSSILDKSLKKRGSGRPRISECDSSILDKSLKKRGRGRLRISECDSSILDKSLKKRGRGRPKISECDSSILDKSLKKRGRGRPKISECDSSILDKSLKKRGRGRPRISECDSSILNKSLKKWGRGHPRISEIKSSEYDVQVKLDPSESEVLTLEVEEQCDSSILDKSLKKRGHGRTRKSEIRSSEFNVQVKLDTSESEVLNFKKRGRGRSRRSEIKSNDCDVQVKPNTSESEILNLEDEEQCDSSILDKSLKKRGRGRLRRSEIKSSDCNVQVKLDTSESEVFNLKEEEQCHSSILDKCSKSLKKRGPGRPRRSEIKSSEYDIQVKLDTSESEALNLEIAEQCGSSILGNQTAVESDEMKELKRKSSIEGVAIIKRSRGRPRKSITVKTNSEIENNLDSSVQDIYNSPKYGRTSLVSESTTGSEILEKRLKSYAKFLSKTINSPKKHSNSGRKNCNTDKNKSQKRKETALKMNPMDSNSAKSPSENEKSKSVGIKRRGRPRKIAVETEEFGREITPKIYSKSKKYMSSSGGMNKPGVEMKLKKRGRGRLRKIKLSGRPKKIKFNENEPNNKKAKANLRLNKEDGDKFLPDSSMDISANESTSIVKRRGRPKKNTEDFFKRDETQLKQRTKRLVGRKPKITEVNLSEDIENSDIDLNNIDLNNSTDPLEIESTSESIDDEESRQNVNKSNGITNSNETLENNRKTPEKKRRGRPKTVVNKPQPISEVNMTSQNITTDSIAESKSAEKRP